DNNIRKRELKTVVMAADGETIVLCGLIDVDVQECVSKVPLLGGSPVMGHLFKNSSTTKRNHNMSIFLKPTIVRDGITASALSSRKYNYIRAEQIKADEEGLSLMPLTKQPVLPEWDGPLTLPPTFEEYLQEQEAQQSGKGGNHD